MFAVVLRNGVVRGNTAPGGVEVVVVVGGGERFALKTPHVRRHWERLHGVETVEPLQTPQRFKVRVLGTAGVTCTAVFMTRDLIRERRTAGCVGASVGGVGVVVLDVAVVVSGIIVFSCSKIPAQTTEVNFEEF